MKQQIHKWLRPMLCFALLAAAACSDDDTDAAASRPVPPVLQTDIPAEGYHFVYFKQEPRTFTMTVQEDCELVVNFSAVAAPGTSNPLKRAVHTLQSLAKTGDNAAAGILALTAIACAGIGLMLVAGNRRRREEDE